LSCDDNVDLELGEGTSLTNSKPESLKRNNSESVRNCRSCSSHQRMVWYLSVLSCESALMLYTFHGTNTSHIKALFERSDNFSPRKLPGKKSRNRGHAEEKASFSLGALGGERAALCLLFTIFTEVHMS
jgi:hypothetical protein